MGDWVVFFQIMGLAVLALIVLLVASRLTLKTRAARRTRDATKADGRRFAERAPSERTDHGAEGR